MEDNQTSCKKHAQPQKETNPVLNTNLTEIKTQGTQRQIFLNGEDPCIDWWKRKWLIRSKTMNLKESLHGERLPISCNITQWLYCSNPRGTSLKLIETQLMREL